jgi:hypothetical protein
VARPRAKAAARLEIGGGELGGKGEGLALIGSLLADGLPAATPGLAISMPRTLVVCADAFRRFLDAPPSGEGAAPGPGAMTPRAVAASGAGYEELRERFLRSPLPAPVVDALREFLPARGRPVIARSSSLYEDAGGEPFSGIYESYAIPNDHPDDEVRLAQLADAVRLVYASMYSPGARAYRDAASCREEDEAMAVAVQELVGSRRGRWFYPMLSGTAQSYNFYPLSYARPEDGLCVAALGLGAYVAEGGAAHRFCPRYPALNAAPPELAGSGSQRAFCALDMERPEPDLLRGESAALEELDLSAAEGTGALDLVASTWDRDDGRLVPGAARDGTRILDLAPLLKYDALPFAPAIAACIEAFEEAAGGPVELEYALDAAPDGEGLALYLLQIKRLARAGAGGVDLEELDPSGCLVASERAMGDGLIAGIEDVLWIDPELFDRSRSREAAEDVAALDRELGARKRPYVLIGPGRWGTRDPWLGVPVVYPQIAHAKAIVETEMPGIPVDFSFGSHFLRNVAERGVGYLAVSERGGSSIDWEWLRALPRERELGPCAVTRLPEPLEVAMDGRRGRALVRRAAKA